MRQPISTAPACPKDLAALRALHCANWRRDYAALIPAELFGRPMAQYMDHKWGAPDTDGMQVRMVRQDAGPVGFIVVFDRASDGIFIDNLHVADGARGQGIGKALMGWAGTLAGARPVALEVLDGNHATRAIYRAWGGLEGAARRVPLLGAEIVERPVTWRSGHDLVAQLQQATRP